MSNPEKPAKRKPGPDPEALRVDAEWTDAVRRALAKGRPPAKAATDQKKRRPSEPRALSPLPRYTRYPSVCAKYAVPESSQLRGGRTGVAEPGMKNRLSVSVRAG